MKRWESKFLRFHNNHAVICNCGRYKDTEVILGDMTNIVAIETILTLAILAIEESASTTGEIKSHYTGRNKSNNRYVLIIDTCKTLSYIFSVARCIYLRLLRNPFFAKIIRTPEESREVEVYSEGEKNSVVFKQEER